MFAIISYRLGDRFKATHNETSTPFTKVNVSIWISQDGQHYKNSHDATAQCVLRVCREDLLGPTPSIGLVKM